MGIIGVVAALTLPNLNSSTGNKEIVSKVKKIHSELNDAYGRAEAVYGAYSTWNSFNDNKKAFDRISEFFKITKVCEPNESGCFASNTFNCLTSSYTYTDNVVNYYKMILASGASVAVFPYDVCHEGEGGCGNFYVDIDGPNKDTNTLGKDIFIFIWTNDLGVIPYSNKDSYYKRCFSFGAACAAWVIYNENTDYLNTDASGHCNNDKNIVLDYTTNTSCK